MRLLAIRGRNLASLAGDFAIDFSDEPLAGAGIFAITGETGAGKSTVLDALCLALYGAVPRLRDGRADAIRDVGEDTISSSAPVSILRRGAVEGRAEVDFEVGGERLTATWAVRRARARPDGRLQKVERAILDDAGEPIAAGIREVEAEVVRRIGLTFDEFRRTVLLAQGEFDAFLKAEDRDRADLLEKVTGTEIYARVSKRVFDIRRELRAGLDELSRRREALGLMDETARAALAEEATSIEDARRGHATRRADLAAILDHHAKSAALAAELAGAGDALDAAKAAHTEADGDRVRLAAIEAAAGLAPVLDAERRAIAAGAKARGRAAEAAGAVTAAETTLAEATEAAGAALEAHHAAAESYREAGPTLDQAARLDTRLDGAVGAVERATDAAGTARTARAEADARLAATKTQLDACRANLVRLTEALAARAALAGMAGRIDEAREIVAGAGAAHERRVAAETTAGAAATAAADAATRHETLKAAIAADEAAIATARANLSDAERELGALDAAATRAARDRLGLAATALAEAERLLGDLRRAETELAGAIAERTGAAAALAAATSEAEAAAQALATAEARALEARSGAALAEAAASDAAARLRAELVDGEPCPVCGARDHVLHEASALDGLAEKLGAARKAADTDLAEAQKRHLAAERALAGGQARAETAARAEETARQRRDAGAEAFPAVAATLAERAIAAGLEPGPLGADEAATSLAALRRALAETTAATAARLDEIARLEAETGRLRSEADRAGDRLAQLRGAAAAAQDEFARRQTASVAAEKERDGRREREAEARSALVRFFAQRGEAPAVILADPAAALARLEAGVSEYEALSAQRLAADGALRGLERDLAQATEAARHQGEVAEGAATRLAQAEAERAGIAAERAEVFGGEATAVVRRRLHQATLDAEEARRVADETKTRAEAGLAAARDEAARAETGRIEAVAAEGEAQTRAGAALAAAGLGREAAVALIAAGREEAPALRARLRTLDDAVTRAEAVMASAGARQAAHAALPAPEIAAEAAQAELAGIDEAVAGLGERAGEIREARRRDAEARAKAETLARDGERLAAEHEVWAAVDAAIGAADGTKFRKFAQGVTLDMLVALASQQLSTLNPRYGLERTGAGELGLMVIDHDMGDEVRSTQSLSGGERFLASLALALALAALDGRAGFVDTLFIDEGFGSLDARSLGTAIEALEALQSRGRRVGVISHVEAMHERIPVQVRIEKQSNGRSRLQVVDRGLVG